MGGASSKAARQFPKTVKPTWAGARTPPPGESKPPKVALHQPPFARASETKDDAIERDSRDPQFMAKLSQLGQVKVDHHMQTFRPAMDHTQRSFQARAQSEQQAQSAHPPRNLLIAASLIDLLEERKQATTRADVEQLATRYDVDVAKLENVAQFVNSPSIAEGSVVRSVGDDGAERWTMKAAWVDPKLQEPVVLRVPRQ